MPGFEYGFKRVASEIIGGSITAAILNFFILAGIVNPSWILIFKILNMISVIILILAMQYWGATYLLGWLVGLLLLFRSGLVGIWDFAIYFGLPLVVLVIRITRNF